MTQARNNSGKAEKKGKKPKNKACLSKKGTLATESKVVPIASEDSSVSSLSTNLSELEKTIRQTVDRAIDNIQLEVSKETPLETVSELDNSIQDMSNLSKKEEVSSFSEAEDSNKNEEPESSPPINENKEAVSLKISSHLKLAEKKIKKLEKENDQLRLENEKLRLDSDALQENFDETVKENEKMKSDHEQEKLSFSDQKKILENTADSQASEIKKLKNKIQKLEKYLNSDIRKTRVKERELENRLELKQSEISAIIQEKDNTLLEYKQELEELREKNLKYQEQKENWEDQKQSEKNKERSAIRALQMSLNILKNKGPIDASEDLLEDFSLDKKESEQEASPSEFSGSLALENDSEDSTKHENEAPLENEENASPQEQENEELKKTG